MRIRTTCARTREREPQSSISQKRNGLTNPTIFGGARELFQPVSHSQNIQVAARGRQAAQARNAIFHPLFKWQADVRPGAISFSAGASLRQRGIACGQRGWK